MPFVMYCTKCKWAGEPGCSYANKCPQCGKKLWTTRGSAEEIQTWLKILEKRREMEGGDGQA